MSADDYIPPKPTLKKMAKAVQDCRGCSLYKNATQAVFGEGPREASLVLVGEQPGNEEDLAGEPFVGPSGRLLDRILAEAGIDRREVYVTNAVKHFKFTRVGKRRLHQRPSASEVNACSPWLDAELEILKPKIVVCMGATAARAVFGKTVTISALRGTFHETPRSPLTYVTNHPSALLRAPEHDAREAAISEMIEDFKRVRKRLRSKS